jgi:hypothetical protein
VIDGHSIPQQTWEPSAPEISATVPMIIGNCTDETALFTLQNTSLYSLDNAGMRDALVKGGVPEGKVASLIALYRRDYPKDSPSDLYFRIAGDRAVRNRAIAQAERKVTQGKGNVFMYHFEWNTPCGDGKIRAFHTAELPLVMRLTMYPESEQLSKQLSGAWAAFARTGNPSQNGLAWPAYTDSTRTTMIFDASRSEARKDPDRGERIMVADLPPGACAEAGESASTTDIRIRRTDRAFAVFGYVRIRAHRETASSSDHVDRFPGRYVLFHPLRQERQAVEGVRDGMRFDFISVSVHRIICWAQSVAGLRQDIEPCKTVHGGSAHLGDHRLVEIEL